ncbi:MAG: glycosyltransferase family 2 protein [Candidatus Hinthialibacter antarcticus]|nr:glycosyltransferase family 2 protein [Candidatus Hinthialibacter antarcticus]
MNDQVVPYPNLTIVAPCYNCGEAVVGVIESCRKFTSNILVVNDGSVDETLKYIQSSGVDSIGWEANQGKGAALKAGFAYWLERPGWDCLITLDSDGQHDPADIPRMMQCRDASGADFVVGRRRFDSESTPMVRRLANKTSSTLIRQLTGCPLHDIQSGFRLFNRPLLEAMLPHIQSSEYAIETEMALWATRNQSQFAECDIECIYTPEATTRSAWRPFLDSYRIAKVTCRHLFKQK